MINDTEDTPELVRVVLDHKSQPTERLWGLLIKPHRVRLLNTSKFCDLAYFDVVHARRICGCGSGDGVAHYEPGERVARGTRRVLMFTKGTGARRKAAVADFLTSWETDDGTPYKVVDHHVFPAVYSCGHVPGLQAQPYDDEGNTLWTLAVPPDTPEERIREFLDRVPHVVFHELMPDEDSDA